MERDWKLPVAAIGILAIVAVAAFAFAYHPERTTPPLAEPFDSTGRTRPSWADNSDAREDARSVHKVEYSYTFVAATGSNGKDATLSTVRDTWIELDADGRPLRATGGTRTGTGDNLSYRWYASPAGEWNWECRGTAGDGPLMHAMPFRPDIDGMLASGFEATPVEPIILPDESPAPPPPAAGSDALLAARELAGTFEGEDSTIDERRYLLDGDARVIAYFATSRKDGVLIGATIKLVTTLEFDVPVADILDTEETAFTLDCGPLTAIS